MVLNYFLFFFFFLIQEYTFHFSGKELLQYLPKIKKSPLKLGLYCNNLSCIFSNEKYYSNTQIPILLASSQTSVSVYIDLHFEVDLRFLIMLIILLIKIKHVLMRSISEGLRNLDLINELYCMCLFTFSLLDCQLLEIRD